MLTRVMVMRLKTDLICDVYLKWTQQKVMKPELVSKAVIYIHPKSLFLHVPCVQIVTHQH